MEKRRIPKDVVVQVDWWKEPISPDSTIDDLITWCEEQKTKGATHFRIDSTHNLIVIKKYKETRKQMEERTKDLEEARKIYSKYNFLNPRVLPCNKTSDYEE